MEDKIEIVKTKTGQGTIIYYSQSGVCFSIHSKYDPLKEAKKFVSEYNIKSDSILIIYGCGMGYHILEAYKKLSSKGKIIVIEFNNLILNASFKNREWKDLVDKGRIKLITKVKDDFVLTFKNLFKEFLRLHCKFHRVKIIVHKNSLQTILISKDIFGVKLREVINFNKNQPNIFLNKEVNYTSHMGVQFEILLKMMVAVSPGIKKLNGKGKSIRRGKAVLKKSPRVSIVIPAWNRWEFTKACLSSVFNITNYKNYEVIVVDNGSKDYTSIGLKEFAQKYDNLKIITNSYNMGTASAKDKGAQYSSGEYLMFIDNDVCPNDPDWLDIMIKTINYHPKIGACGVFGVICLSDDNDLIQVQKILIPNIIVPVDWCAGYCIMIRRQAMIDSGGYRGDLFKLVDMEDIHIGYALRNKGWAIVNIPIDLGIRRIEDSHIEEIDGILRTTICARNERIFRIEWGPRKRLLNNFESNRTIDGLWSKEKQGFCE